MKIKLKDRSYFGQGIIACKQGKNLQDCPYSKFDKPFAYEQWTAGFNACNVGIYSAMKSYGFYEDI